MNGQALVHIALNVLLCSQRDLAIRLKVSPAQISKWKQGEHMSEAAAQQLRLICDIGDLDPSLVVWAGSTPDALAWRELIGEIAGLTNEGAETGFDVPLLVDTPNLATELLLQILLKLGIEGPVPYPPKLKGLESVSSAAELDPHAALISDIFSSFADVYGYYCAYIAELVAATGTEFHGEYENLDEALLCLAAAKLEDPPEMAQKFRYFRMGVVRDFEEWLRTLKQDAVSASIPLRAEVMDLIWEDSEYLSNQADRETMGFNDLRIHPDVYMNELLIGMRTIHQVLPKILEKLDIDFKLDESALFP